MKRSDIRFSKTVKETDLTEFLNRTFFGNSVFAYFSALSFVVVLSIVLTISSKIIFRKKNEDSGFLSETLKKHFFPALYFLVLYAGLRFLSLPETLCRIIDKTSLVAAIIFVVRFLIFAVSYFLKRSYDGDTKTGAAKIPLMPFVKIVLWSAGLLFVLDNFGFDINTLLAGLGIGGVAVALAAQAVLRDLFNYFVIVTDRPFLIGDFITVGDFKGTVERIGIKSTRLISISGERLIFSNTFLAESVIKNYSEMKTRRIVFNIQVKYETQLSKIKEIPGLIKKAVEETEGAIYDRSHFGSFSDWGLVFEAVYFIEGGDYLKYMDVQQKINSKTFELLSESGIEFAYPTQIIHLEKHENGES